MISMIPAAGNSPSPAAAAAEVPRRLADVYAAPGQRRPGCRPVPDAQAGPELSRPAGTVTVTLSVTESRPLCHSYPDS